MNELHFTVKLNRMIQIKTVLYRNWSYIIEDGVVSKVLITTH